ncbi:MAG: oligosaccharide flippase family protein, partial [Cyanobacteria bacterium REEB65]|nr:oligosaccharide flippase family protein [Cyanobacteria bacterium REEB65]
MRDLAGQALVYALGSAIGAGANLFLLGVYGHALPPADFGRLETLSASQQILLILSAGGLGSALFGIYEEQQTDRDRADVAGTALWLVTAIAGAMCLTVWSLAPCIAERLKGFDAPLIRLIALQAAFGAIGLIPQALHRAESRAAWFVGLSAGQALLTATLATLAVRNLHWGLPGALGAGAIGAGCLALAAW